MWMPTEGPAAAFAAEYLPLHRDFYARELADDTLRDWRVLQLSKVLTQVSAGSPFYAKHLSGVDPATVDSDDLTALPFTTKQDLRREMLGVLSRPLHEAMFFYETTGTTGAATPCPRDGR